MRKANSKKLERSARIFRLVRKRYKLTQSELASQLGRLQSFISKTEKGTLQPSAREWFEFCLKFGIEPQILLAPAERCSLSSTMNSNPS